LSTAPLPNVEWPLIREFWLAAKEERLVIPRCDGCERYVWYPEEVCPGCGANEIPWVAMGGKAQLYSWAQVKHPLYPPYKDQLPYITGLVILEEAPAIRYVTRLVDCETTELKIEMPMEVVYRELTFSGVEGSVVAPVFKPAR
jgi:uncharacterized OB-fold protein